jgi:hypothetical protein
MKEHKILRYKSEAVDIFKNDCKRLVKVITAPKNDDTNMNLQSLLQIEHRF